MCEESELSELSLLLHGFLVDCFLGGTFISSFPVEMCEESELSELSEPACTISHWLPKTIGPALLSKADNAGVNESAGSRGPSSVSSGAASRFD
jgi:hypothetical protein